MCQMNVYMVSANVEEKNVKKCFRNPMYVYQNTKNYKSEKYKDYNFYEYLEGMCNCGSIVAHFADTSELPDVPYDLYITKQNQEKLEKLYKIRELQQQPDYEKQLEQYQKEKDRLFDIYQKRVEKDNLDYIEADETPESKAYCTYMEDNQLLDDSAMYPVNPDKDLPFTTVHEDIAELEKIVAEGYQPCDEFICLKNAFGKILEIAPEIKVFAYWMDGDPMENLVESKTIHIDELTEDILSRLGYEEVLTIIK